MINNSTYVTLVPSNYI